MQPVYRFFHTGTGQHFLTGDAAERAALLATLPHYRYEGIAWLADETAAAPTARFLNTASGAHFYTASADEAAAVRARLPAMREESAGFPAAPEAPAPDALPVWRFYRADADSHFYTADAAERQAVADGLATVYRLEGVAFWAGRAASAAENAASFPAGTVDPGWYLAAYGDVRDAVLAGRTTAQGHYEAFGQAEGRLRVWSEALAGDDAVTAGNAAVPGTINGGAGDDTLSGGADIVRLYGETGDDQLSGEAGQDLNGGAGDDTYRLTYGWSAAAGAAVGPSLTEGAGMGEDTAVFAFREEAGLLETLAIDLADFPHVETVAVATKSGVLPGLGGRYLVTGTDGADAVRQTGPTFRSNVNELTADLGAGDDRVHVTSVADLTLGPGADTVTARAIDATTLFAGSAVAATLRDFDPDGGDRVEIAIEAGSAYRATIFADPEDGPTVAFLETTQVGSPNRFAFHFPNRALAELDEGWFSLV